MSQYGLEDSVGYWLRRTSNEMHARFTEALAQYDVTPAHWTVLVSLYDGSAATPNELVVKVEVDPATISRRLDQLEEKGLIRRHPDPVDRRATRLALTSEGRALTPKLAAISEAINQTALRGFSDSERADLIDRLARLLGNLQRA
ncbi:MAG: MarR family transcriptional regulator [Alphaproteobacteria bacterium]|nr:MarR family transcriptional regulator [Alphaproteobacteria bacterium]